IECSGQAPIYIDSYLMQQVLVNILFNAVEAAGSNLAVPENERFVVLASTSNGSGWNILVSDTGAGIAPDDQRQMFDPFFTTKQGGTGLGLTIVHSIVRAHGGTIEIESACGAGTKVS